MPTPKGLRYPSSSGAVVVPADVQKLAEDVDGLLVPATGGTYSGLVTFSQPPNVPTPVVSTNAATKAYVDQAPANIVDGAVTSPKLATGLSLTATTPEPVFGANLAPAIGSWTGTDATWSSPNWTVSAGGELSASIAVTSGTRYQIDITASDSNGDLTFTIGAVSVTQPASQKSAVVTAGATGTLTVKVGWSGTASVQNVVVRSVVSASPVATLGGEELRVGGTNNIALGSNAQYSLTSGYANLGLGVNAGRATTTGSYNVHIGHSVGYMGTVATISGSVCIGVSSVGVSAQATEDDEFVLGVAAHHVKVAGEFETTASGNGIIVRSPDGTRYRVGVDNAGSLTVAAA